MVARNTWHFFEHIISTRNYSSSSLIFVDLLSGKAKEASGGLKTPRIGQTAWWKIPPYGCLGRDAAPLPSTGRELLFCPDTDFTLAEEFATGLSFHQDLTKDAIHGVNAKRKNGSCAVCALVFLGWKLGCLGVFFCTKWVQNCAGEKLKFGCSRPDFAAKHVTKMHTFLSIHVFLSLRGHNETSCFCILAL